MTSLATSGRLVSIEIGVWGGSVRDRAVGAEVAHDKEADSDSVEVTKKLLAGCAEHKACLTNRQGVYNWAKSFTLPWAGGFNYLMTARDAKFMREYQDREAETNRLAAEFIRVYPDVVSNTAFAKQGKLFNRTDYPAVEILKNKFFIVLHSMPVPIEDPRCQVSVVAAEDAYKHYMRQTEDYFNTMTDKIGKDLHAVVSSLAYCCDSEVATNKKGETVVRKRRLYDSTVHRAIELCETLKQFTVIDNPDIVEARDALDKALSGLTPEVLRENDTVRHDVKNSMEDILSKFRV
jgi:hypothetical protein